jgi:tripartite-type tricarboxylate transporter receptor subunit TctC
VPPPVVQRLNTEIAAVLEEPALRAKLAAQGLDIRREDPARLRAFLAAEIENWGRVVRTLGISPQ